MHEEEGEMSGSDGRVLSEEEMNIEEGAECEATATEEFSVGSSAAASDRVTGSAGAATGASVASIRDSKAQGRNPFTVSRAAQLHLKKTVKAAAQTEPLLVALQSQSLDAANAAVQLLFFCRQYFHLLTLPSSKLLKSDCT